MHIPSMTTWSVSLRTRTVVMMTNIEKTNVQMGSANLYSSPSCNNKTANEISRLNTTIWNFLVHWYQRSVDLKTFANICHYKYNGYLYWGWRSGVGVWKIHWIGLVNVPNMYRVHMLCLSTGIHTQVLYFWKISLHEICSILIVLHRSHFNVSLKIPVVCSDHWWTIFLVYYKFTLPDWPLTIRWRRMVIHLGQ